jgi:hypothetical protein
VPPRLLASDTNDMLFVEEKVEKDRKRGLKRFECRAFFCNFAIKKMAKLLCLGKKRNEFLCFALDFS